VCEQVGHDGAFNEGGSVHAQILPHSEGLSTCKTKKIYLRFRQIKNPPDIAQKEKRKPFGIGGF
jgi:hypothetical protein